MWFRSYGVAWAFMLISVRRRELTWGDIFENGVPDMQTEGRKDGFLPPASATSAQKLIHIAQLCLDLLPTHRNPDCKLSNKFDH
jgi:hypothetical protein